MKRWRSFRPVLLLFVTTSMLMLIPMLANYLANNIEVSIQAMALPTILNLLTAALITLGFWRWLRRDLLAGYIAASLTAIVLSTDYDGRLSSISPLIAAILPLPKFSSSASLIISLVFIAIIAGLSYWVGRVVSGFVRRQNWQVRELVIGLALAISVTFLSQFIPSVRAIAAAWPQYFYKPPALALNNASAKSRPDIYYIVMEDYANQNQLKAQFNFDNASFSNYLASNGYYLNPNAHQNYPYTTMSIASTLSAGYNTDIINKFKNSGSGTIIPYHRAIQYGSVISALKGLGYQYDEIGSWYETTNRGPLANSFYLKDRQLTILGHHSFIDGFTQDQIADGVWWRLFDAGVSIGHFTIASYKGQSQVDLTKTSLDTLRSLANQPAGGRLILTHLIIPHEPYYFNGDGSLSTAPNSDNSGQPVKQKYLGQIQYINTQMEQILSAIKQHSNGQAAVILQSDEGPQPFDLNDQINSKESDNNEINNHNMTYWSQSDLDLKYGNMVAYNLPGVNPTDLAAGANNLNIFRLVLNTYFNQQLPYLPECYYAYPKGRSQPFGYADITERISGQANSACAADGTNPK